MNDINSYLKQLVSIGRKVGCFEQSEKQSDKLTETQQETLTGYLIKSYSKDNLTICDCLHNQGQQKTLDFLIEYLLEDNERNATNFLRQIKETCVLNFYKNANDILQEANCLHEVEVMKEQGLKAEICNQTGETIWK